MSAEVHNTHTNRQQPVDNLKNIIKNLGNCFAREYHSRRPSVYSANIIA